MRFLQGTFYKKSSLTMSQVQENVTNPVDSSCLTDTIPVYGEHEGAYVQKLPVQRKRKTRTTQEEDEFQKQYRQFTCEGPLLSMESFFFDSVVLRSLDLTRKTDRSWLLHAIEKAYYDKRFLDCSHMIEEAKKLFNIGDHHVEDKHQLDKKIRKSTKIERHIADLLHMDMKCKSKLARNFGEG